MHLIHQPRTTLGQDMFYHVRQASGLTNHMLVKARRSMNKAIKACNLSQRPVLALNPKRWDSAEDLASCSHFDAGWHQFTRLDEHETLEPLNP